MIFTAKINNKFTDQGEKIVHHMIVMDITVKNNPTHVLAPTWGIVMEFKRGKITWDEYKKRYIALLIERYKMRKDEFINIIKLSRQYNVVLTCFCRDPNQCHRSLAKEFLDSLKNQI